MTRTILASLLGLALASSAAAQGQYDQRYQEQQQRPYPENGPYQDQRNGYPDARNYRDERAVRDENVNYAYADVLRADPIYETIRESQPREECYDERVVTQEPRGGNTTGGTIIGAIVGGALGNQVGKGDGRKAATVAGAVIGGAIGNNVDRNNGPGRSYETTQTRCQVVDGGNYERREIVGYDVEYRYRGDVYMSRLDYNPGDRLRVRVSVTPAD
ncbi:MAG TPA: glycine zipper 2TM domain-containing protein [Xanthomonadales bacterium]|nr:glycine zipper 2TM domain-containing protein [Xanthomonadales bacterium]